MSATSVGKIGLDLVLNSKKFDKQLDGIKSQAKGVSNQIVSSFKPIAGAVAATFSTAAIVAFSKQCIEVSASVKAANSQYVQTFRDMSKQATATITAVAKESGILQTRLRGVGTSIYAFAKTTGMDSAQALTLMQDALKVTADSAAYYDRSLEETAESLKSFLKGNFENDAALGLSCTETTRNAAANKLYGKSFKDLSEAQKQLTLLEMVKDANRLSGALGQASRESDGWENVIGNLKESWNQFLAVIGQPILQGAVVVVKKITLALQELTAQLKSAIDALYSFFGLSNEESITNTSVIAENIDTSVENQNDLTKATAETNKEAKRGVANFDKLNIIGSPDSGSSGSSEPSGSASSASTPPALIPDKSASDSAKSFGDKFKDIFKGFYEKSGFKDFISKIQKGIDKVDWKSIGANCKSIFKNLQPIAKSYIKNTVDTGASALKAIGSYAGGMVSVFGKSLQTVSGGVAQWLSKDSGKITDFIENFNQSCQNGFDNLSDFFDSWFGLVGDSIDRMRPTVQNAISNYLSGITNFATSIGTVLAESFEIASGSLNTWLSEDGEVISEYFDNLQLVASELYSTFGTIFSDIGDIVSEWWNSEGGSTVFSNVCDMFLSMGTTLMSVWNEWIKPAWDFITGTIKDAWDNWLKPVFDSGMSYIGKLFDCISTLWNNILKPVADWLIKTWGPTFTNIFNGIRRVLKTVFSHIGGIISSAFDTFGGLLDFLTGVFSGDWDKAWQGIKDAFKGVWSGLVTVVSTVVNLIIDGINILWNNVYTSFQQAANGIGSIAERIGEMFGEDWGFSVPENTPFIPRWEPNLKLAKGGIIKAPTIAVVGDNPGAGNGDPEVVSPLSKLQTMIDTSSGQDTVLLAQILDYLKRLYEMFVVFKNNGGNMLQFIATLEGETLFKEVVRQNELYKKQHNGKSAF